jgi:hypothetical protein
MAFRKAQRDNIPLPFFFYRTYLKKSRKEVILMTSLETTDIFRGAFFMCMGGDLEDIRFRQSRSQIASFMFTGNNLHKYDKAYLNGHALVNPVLITTIFLRFFCIKLHIILTTDMKADSLLRYAMYIVFLTKDIKKELRRRNYTNRHLLLNKTGYQISSIHLITHSIVSGNIKMHFPKSIFKHI